MRERERYALATQTAEAMYQLWQLSYHKGDLSLDGMMRRLKDLAAYSLLHAEILEQREGVEMLALGMLFGMTSDPTFHPNQERLRLLSEETMAYQGQAGLVEREVALRQAAGYHRGEVSREPDQPRLL
jgi:hypothetical protein